MKSSATARNLESAASNGRASTERPEPLLDAWAHRAIVRRVSAFGSHTERDTGRDGSRCSKRLTGSWRWDAQKRWRWSWTVRKFKADA